MLVEVKAKVSRILSGKTRKRTETFLVTDCDIFSDAEYMVMSSLIHEQEEGTVSSSEIISLRQSPIKEVADQFTGEYSFIATLKDIFHDDEGNEKILKYKVLLWADSLTQANQSVQQLAREGYDMQIESIKQVDYEYLVKQPNQEKETKNESQ